VVDSRGVGTDLTGRKKAVNVTGWEGEARLLKEDKQRGIISMSNPVE
jgi:hypothetical protein